MKIKIQKITSLALILALLVTFLPLQTAQAGLLNMSNTLSTVRAGVLANHTIVFRTPAGVDAPADTITITFPAGFIMGTVAFGDIDLAVSAGDQTACPVGLVFTDRTLAAAATTGVWGAAVSGQILTLTPPTNATTGEVPVNACVQIEIGTNATFTVAGVNQITNPVAGSYAITIAGGFGNTGSILVTIIADDRVAVTADVAATLSFAISDVTIGFGTLSATATRWADSTGAGSDTSVSAHNFTASTNAISGYTVTLSGATLTMGAHTITAIGPIAVAPSIGTEQFGLRIVHTGGAGVPSAPYNTANFAFDFAAMPDEVAASPTASITTTFDVFYIANISAITEAGAYTTALTYVATGRF